jgi:hypothetical protein
MYAQCKLEDQSVRRWLKVHDTYVTTRLLYEKHPQADTSHTTPDSGTGGHPDEVTAAIQESQPLVATADVTDPPNIEARCSSVADDRAGDAAAGGYEPELQQAVHDGAYKDCMSWHTAHDWAAVTLAQAGLHQ